MIPWGRHWIIGTTDTPWDLDLAHPAASRADIDYVLEAREQDPAHAAGPRRRPGRVRRAAAAAQGRHRADLEDLPRAHRRHAGPGPGDDRRRQADHVSRDGARRRRRGREVPRRGTVRESITERVPLLGASGFEARTNQRVALARSSGLDIAAIDHLLGRFGGLIDEVLGLIAQRPGAWPAAGRVGGVPRRRGGLRGHPRGCAPPRRRTRPAYAHLHRVLRPRHDVGAARRRADGRASSAGTPRDSRTRSTTTCAASRPSGRARRSSPTRRPTKQGQGARRSLGILSEAQAERKDGAETAQIPGERSGGGGGLCRLGEPPTAVAATAAGTKSRRLAQPRLKGAPPALRNSGPRASTAGFSMTSYSPTPRSTAATPTSSPSGGRRCWSTSTSRTTRTSPGTTSAGSSVPTAVIR